MKTQTKQREKNTVVEMCLFQVFLFRATCNCILFYFILFPMMVKQNLLQLPVSTGMSVFYVC